jgi:hypothetical protein
MGLALRLFASIQSHHRQQNRYPDWVSTLEHRLTRMRLAIDIGFHGRDMAEMVCVALKRKQRGRDDRAVCDACMRGVRCFRTDKPGKVRRQNPSEREK